jgi:hypothetical protein
MDSLDKLKTVVMMRVPLRESRVIYLHFDIGE